MSREASQLPGLDIDDVTVRFGGLVAVSGVTLNAPAGQITGLIGPNGAGKTTTFNACTGVVPTSSGRVRLGNTVLDGHGTSSRAARGLGRTFQRMELFDSMTVVENVELGVESFLAAGRPFGQLFCPPGERKKIAALAKDAVEHCGLTHLARRNAGDLSTGQRRLVELARAIATPFTFLLLDEPSSGLDPSETDRFGEILRDYVAESGVGILLVEHDMALVSGICSYIYVLDFGRLIHQGPTAEALASPIVLEAYLGAESSALESAAEETAHA
ncbi:ABC transporter ATP-binding protein [Sporichthya polymorpha]|uniref:ABC transporter ATP-binding protein n=1 Tax=Sporichthya polymorpha TaxID=35751 RepID=UPI00039B55FA|nr:ABC transporter ATP-binding protein [Sporichthya polymorpha]